MATLPVKWFDYSTAPTGAPTLTGQAGSLIALLDAVLVTGYNVRAVQSLTVAAGAGTLEFGSADHGYVKHQVIRVEGALNAAYNGEWRVTAVNSTSIVLDMSGVADGSESANAALAARVAPLGWAKPFAGTNKAAYQSQGAGATGCLLRVDDSVGTYARVRGYETLTDIDTGTGMFPTAAQRAESNWGKSKDTSATPRRWTIIGDDRFFYFTVHTEYGSFASYPNARHGVAFGDIVSFKEGDAFHAILFSISSTSISYFNHEGYGNILHRLMDYGTSSRAYLARTSTQLGGSKDVFLMGSFSSVRGMSGRDTGVIYPNPADNGLLLSQGNFVVDGNTLRGELPGYYACMQDRPLTHGVLLEDIVPGRVLMMMGTAYDGLSDTRWALDITGPWR